MYTALLQPHDRIMGLDLPSGGHLTHGYYTANGGLGSCWRTTVQAVLAASNLRWCFGGCSGT